MLCPTVRWKDLVRSDTVRLPPACPSRTRPISVLCYSSLRPILLKPKIVASPSCALHHQSLLQQESIHWRAHFSSSCRHSAKRKMVRENQLYIHEDDNDYICDTCHEYWRSANCALNHCRNYHQDEWCERCEWLFVSPDACESHLNNSPNHHLCEACDLDFESNKDLINHLREENWCWDCREYFDELEDHRAEVHLCDVCNVYVEDMKDHNTDVHICIDCNIYVDDMDDHNRQVHLCTDCVGLFIDLHDHDIEVHHKCPHCGMFP